MLVQREMESLRPDSEYNPISAEATFDAQRSGGWHKRAPAETATGFKREISLRGPIYYRACCVPAVDLYFEWESTTGRGKYNCSTRSRMFWVKLAGSVDS